MDLNECFRKGLIKKTTKDSGLIKSLKEMADNKEMTIKRATLDNISISTYVSIAYDSLREILEGICILHEYKTISHVCIGELLRDMLKEFNFEEFDRIRWIRNGINYYGEQVELEQGKDLIKKIFKMKQEMSKKLRDIK
ncbi:MAG: hypothetical protein AABW49_04550 [Nanoarchaeota archaeon]